MTQVILSAEVPSRIWAIKQFHCDTIGTNNIIYFG